MQAAWVRSLGWEDPVEKETATHSNILAWKIPWTEEPDRLQSMGSQRVGHDFTFTFIDFHCTDEKTETRGNEATQLFRSPHPSSH